MKLFLEQFTKENIINNLSKYETLYQVSLGKIIHDTGVSNEGLSYEVDFKLALGSIYELIKDLQDVENAELKFDVELDKQISIDALQYFVNENYDAVKDGLIQIEELITQINDSKFFNEAMLEVYRANIVTNRNKYEEFITDELAQNIYDSVVELTEPQTQN